MGEMTHEELQERLLDILEDICGDEDVRDHRDEDLFASGMLDSMGAIELLVSIKEEFGVSIGTTEVDRDQMNTVNLIVHQVETRL